MQTLAVVDFLAEKGKPNLNICQRSVFPEIDFLDFDRFKEAFGGGIVIGISLSGHADQKAVFQEHPHVVVRGLLDSPIGVMDNPLPSHSHVLQNNR